MVFAVWAAQRDCDPEALGAHRPRAARRRGRGLRARRPRRAGGGRAPRLPGRLPRALLREAALRLRRARARRASSASTRWPPSAARSRARPSCASPTPLAYADADGSRRRHPPRRRPSSSSVLEGDRLSDDDAADAAALARPRRRRPRGRRDALAQERSRRGHVHRRPEHQLHERLHHRLRLLRLLPAPGRHARGLRPARSP